MNRTFFERLIDMSIESLTDALRRGLLNTIDIELPDTEALVLGAVEVQLPSRVLLYNDEVHTFDEVILQLMKATGCQIHEAELLALEVDLRGQAYVFEGEMLRCLNVSSVLEEIALLTEVEF